MTRGLFSLALVLVVGVVLMTIIARMVSPSANIVRCWKMWWIWKILVATKDLLADYPDYAMIKVVVDVEDCRHWILRAFASSILDIEVVVVEIDCYKKPEKY